jgi:hypothetical protein
VAEIPADAITAALAAATKADYSAITTRSVTLLLEAAAPAIRAQAAAADRERIRQLAIDHNAVADPCYDQTPFEQLIGGES